MVNFTLVGTAGVEPASRGSSNHRSTIGVTSPLPAVASGEGGFYLQFLLNPFFQRPKQDSNLQTSSPTKKITSKNSRGEFFIGREEECASKCRSQPANRLPIRQFFATLPNTAAIPTQSEWLPKRVVPKILLCFHNLLIYDIAIWQTQYYAIKASGQCAHVNSMLIGTVYRNLLLIDQRTVFAVSFYH